MINPKLPGELQEDEQRPIGNAGDDLGDGGKPPTADRAKIPGPRGVPSDAEKSGVKPEGEWPDRGVNHRSQGK
jgi:hypothetical protein